MKNLAKTLLTALALVLATGTLSAQCLSATYGLYPSAAYTPNCNNTTQSITTLGYASEYSNVNVITGNTYIFTSSISGDFITIANSAGTSAFTTGTGSVTWVATVTGSVRFYTHTNSGCGSSTTFRTRSVRCTGAVAPCTDFTFSAPFSHSSSTAGAGNDCSLRSSDDRVYAINIATAGCYTFSLCGGASWDTYLLLTTSCCGGSTIASNDDACGLQSQLSNVSLTPGTYYLAVEAFGSGSGAYTLNVTSSVPSAGTITASSPIFCGSTATYSVPFQSGVTFTWSVPSGATIVSGQGSNSITVNWTSGSGTVSVVPSSSCGTGAASSLNSGCTPPPACNDFSFSAPFSHSFNTCGAVDNSSLRTGEDVIYKVNIPTAGCYDFSLCGGATWDTYLYLTTACPGTGGTPGGGTIIASNDDFCGLQSQLSNVTLTPGVYYLTVEPFSSTGCGAYTLNVTPGSAPTASAISVTTPFGCNSTVSFSVGSVSGVTYTWSTTNGTIVSGQGTSSVSIAWGSGTGTVSVVPSNGCGTGAAVSTTVTCTPPPSNDNCAAALPFIGASQAFSTVFATGTDITSCTFNDFNDVWFKWVSPSCGQVTFSTCGGASFDTHLSLFTSCNGTEIACNDDACGLQSTITANVTAGTVYYLRAAGYNGAQGTGTITMSMTAPLSANASGSNVSCFGGNDGSASVTASNGSGSYSYLWSNGSTSSSISGLTAGSYSVTVTDGYGCSVVSSYTVTEPTALGGSLVAQTYVGGYNISCAGNADGSIYANISGGTAPYSYAWSNGASTQLVSGLAAGSYSVVVTDANGCVFNASISLTEPAPMANSYTSSTYACGTNVSCNGATDGSIDLSVTGGSGNYMYQWSNGATTEDLSGLAAGTYSVTATDQNGCSTSASVTLTEPALLSTSLSTSAYSCGYGVSCFGASNGSVASATTGGCAPYTYQWSNGGIGGTINGVAAGMYSVTVTDANGCQAFATAEITQPQPVTVSCSPNATVYYGWGPLSCTTITASGIGGGCPPYSISWSNGATTASTTVCPTVSTDYTVTVTDANGCTATCVTRVCVQDVRCGNNLQKIQLCHYPPGNSNNPQTLCVNPNAVQNQLNQNPLNHLGACGTNLPCAAPLKTSGSQPAASVEAEAVEMEAFPNPFQSATVLRFSVPTDDQVKLTVFSMDGREVGVLYDGQVEAHQSVQVNFNANNNANGIYFAKLMTSSGEVTTLKLVLVK